MTIKEFTATVDQVKGKTNEIDCTTADSVDEMNQQKDGVAELAARVDELSDTE